MGGRGSDSGLGKELSERDIAKRLPDEKYFNLEKVPKLEGSEKQIKWANDIRRSVIKELSSVLYENDDGRFDTTEMFAAARKGKKEMIKYMKRTYDVRKQEPNYSFSTSQAREYNKKIVINDIEKFKGIADRVQRFNQVVGEKSAKWWIENRNNSFELREYIHGKRKKP